MANKFYTRDGEVQPETADPKASVPVWDPDTQSLRALDKSRADALAKEGYAVGPEALGKGIRDSAEYKAAGFAAQFGHAGSMGLSNLANLAAGNEQGLRETKAYDRDNPWSSGAAQFLGYGASYALGAGQLGVGAAANVASKAPILSKLAHVVLPGLPAASIEGASDELTRDALMRDPVTLDNIAASMFTHVVVNSVGNALGYGVGKSLQSLRNKSGAWLDWMERNGFHKVKLRRIANVETEPRVSRATFSGEQPIDATMPSAQEVAQAGADDAIEKAQAEQMAQAPIAREAGVPGMAAGKDATASAAQGAVKSEPVPHDATPEQIQPHFEWPKGYTKTNKTSVLTRMMKHVVGKDPTNLQIWNESTAVAKEIGKYQDAVKRGDLDAGKVAPLVDKLVRQKEEYKDYLRKYVKGSIDGDKYIPGFADLDAEYARVSGNAYHDLKDPVVTLPRVATGDVAAKDATKSAAFPRAATTAKATKPGKARYSVSFTFPKKPPEYARVGVEQPYSGTAIAATLGMSWIPGIGTPAKVAAGYMGARNSLAFLASNREPIGQVVGKIGDELLKYGTPTIRTAVRTLGERGQKESHRGIPPVNLEDYTHATDILGNAASNPQMIQNYMQNTYPSFHEEYPEAAAHITMSTIRTARMLYDTVPKRPYPPTLRDTNFLPPRAQQHRVLTRWQIISNPEMALQSGDPQTLQLLREVYPDWYDASVKRLMDETQKFRGDVDGQVARHITAFTGAPVNPINNAAAQKRMHATAMPAPPNAGQQGQPSTRVGGGPQSAKTSNAAAHRDDPSFELN